MKFQCNSCKGIVVVDFEGDTVSCGMCGAVCRVPSSLSEGVVIDDFLIVRKLGSGGMGDVYLAHEFSLDRKVALKILKDSISKNDEVSESFIKEARSVASLNHPNIIQAHKVGFDDGILFFAMEYVQGQNLQDILKSDGMMEELQVLTIASEVVTALGYAWDKRQLVHRDIKPENIMISNEDGRTKLMDLGLSCHAGEEDGEGDQISGTPQYISPEQIMGTEIDIRTDFYCLGATLYHLLSGQFPFRGSLQDIVKAHLSEAPRSLKKHRPDLSENTVKIIHRLLKKEPDDRYSSAEKLLKELEKTKHMITNVNKSKKHIHIKPTEVKTHYKTEKRKNRKDESQKKKILAVLGLVLFVTFGGILLLAGKMLKSKPAEAEKENLADSSKTKIIYKTKSTAASLTKDSEQVEKSVENLTGPSPEDFSNFPENDKGVVHQYSFDSPEEFPEVPNSLLAIDTKNKAHFIVTKANIHNGFLDFDTGKGSKAKISGKLKAKMDETLKDKSEFSFEAWIRCDDETILSNEYLSKMVGGRGMQLDSSKYYYFAKSVNLNGQNVRVYLGTAGESLFHKKFNMPKEKLNEFNFPLNHALSLDAILGFKVFRGELHELRIRDRLNPLQRAKEVVGAPQSTVLHSENNLSTSTPVSSEVKVQGLKYRAFRVTDITFLDKYDDLEAIGSGHARSINVNAIFPKVEKIGLVYEGFLKVPKAGQYRLKMDTNENFYLFINGENTLYRNDDGKDTAKTISLKEGYNPLKIVYCNLKGERELKFQQENEDKDRVDIPREWLYMDEIKPESKTEGLIAYEGFNYTAETKTWKSGGGVGWKGNWWTNKGGGAILTSPFLPSVPLKRNKNSIEIKGSDIVRAFDVGLNFTPLYNKKGIKTFYLSYMFKASNPKGKFYTGYIGYQGNDFVKTAGIGNNGQTKTFKFLSGHKSFSLKEFNDQVNFVVIRLDFTGKNGMAKVYFNPDLESEPEKADWRKRMSGINFGGVIFESDDETTITVDEVRYGTTYESVTPKE